MKLEDLTVEVFAAHVGDPFHIHPESGRTVDTTLMEARPIGSPPKPGSERGAARRVPFSLLFRGPAAPVLPQRIYRLEHATIGGLDIFIVPVGFDGDALLYEAIFT